MGFSILLSENCIFINRELNIIIYVYIDDVAIIGPNKYIILSFIKNLEKFFKLKNLGPIKDYLGIEIDLN